MYLSQTGSTMSVSASLLRSTICGGDALREDDEARPAEL
jgi:hypothetical protein